jgi:ceramide glucosyltransferase
MCGEIVLALWSAAGVAWWIIAWRLVRNARRENPSHVTVVSPRSLSIFKPLPPLESRALEVFAPGLESFVAQMDPESELLLGVHRADRARVLPFVETMRAKYPKAQLRPVYRVEPDAVANPKIAWQMHLASEATGELWLWSDADTIAPPGFLQSARAEFAKCGAGMITFPYVVRKVSKPSALFEALFVNAEFYPGVLLLRQRGATDFGLGAAMLFERERFQQRVDWAELGAYLADDFQLGQRLQPVRIGTATLETVACESTWPDALRHDLRWSKTVRWNRPGGYFARLLVLPVAGWLVAVASHPGQIFAWVGLLGMIQAEVAASAVICREIGCRLNGKDFVMLECWSLWRVVVWILCWLPVTVVWSGQIWRGPKAVTLNSADAVPVRKPLTFHD